MKYRITCFVLALFVPLSTASAFDESHGSKLHALNKCVGCDLGLADLQNLDPSYANLTGAVLRNANLSAAVLSGAKLTSEGIRGAILQGALLRNGNLIGAVLSASSLTDADSRSVILQEVLLRNGNLVGAVLSTSSLTDANIRGALSEHSNWPTIPQLFCKGELIGGCDITVELHTKGELKDILK